MHNPTKSAVLKASEKQKRLEAALKRNMLRRKEQVNQRHHAQATLNKNGRGINHDNVG
jgi:hypothetical protein